MSSRCFKAVRPSCLSVCLLLAGGGAFAQSTGASAPGAASVAPADAKAQQLSDVERAKRDADKVFQWIKFHAEKGETKKADNRNEKPEKHEARAEPKPEPKAQPAVVKVAAPSPVPVRKPEQDNEPRPMATAAAFDAQRADQAGSAPSRNAGVGGVAAAPAPAPLSVSAPPPAFTGRVPEVMAMAPPTTTPALGTPPQQNEPEPAPLPEEDTPLKLISKVDPEYPRALLSQQRNGSVMVKFIVQTDGSVESVEATRSPDRKLSAAAIAAVKQWRFAPLNKPRPVSVEIGFQME